MPRFYEPDGLVFDSLLDYGRRPPSQPLPIQVNGVVPDRLDEDIVDYIDPYEAAAWDTMLAQRDAEADNNEVDLFSIAQAIELQPPRQSHSSRADHPAGGKGRKDRWRK